LAILASLGETVGVLVLISHIPYLTATVFRLPGVDVDDAMTYELPIGGQPPIQPTDTICKSTQLTFDSSFALHAAPGDNITLRYQENGHITLPETKPQKPNPGIVYVYGTTDSQPTDTLLDIHHVWTPDGTGGDGRGTLVAEFPFDDGRCYQINNGTISQQRQSLFPHGLDPLMGLNWWCGTNLTIPMVSVGEVLSLYWVWDWPSSPGTPQELPEIYTTCLDIVIV